MAGGVPAGANRPYQALNLQAIVRRGEARQTAVRRMVQRSRRLGYGFNQEDIIPGIAAIGVAIRSPSGVPLASLSLAATGADLAARQPRLLGLLTAEADRIAAQLAPLRYPP